MKKFALCIPTFNRPEILKDICMKIERTAYIDLFDIYIYDSSPNQNTEIELHNIIGNSNFYYIKVDSEVHSSKKVYDIYQNEYIQNEYEYLWILPDYLFFSDEVIGRIVEKADEKWDMIMLDFYDPERRGDRPYSNPNDIFFEYAWSLTQFGIMVLNCKTVLKRSDWNYLEEKYLVEQYRNFSHILMYFELMLQIEHLRFFHFFISPDEVYRSKYKGKQSEYIKDFLEVWGRCWYESIYALPDDYCNKEKVIKKACIYTKSLDIQNLAELRKQGILTIKTLKKYISIWSVVSTVPIYKVWTLLILPGLVVDLIAEYGTFKAGLIQFSILIKMERFCKNYDEIYLYGAGVMAEKTADYLDKAAIPFKGFIVSSLKDNKNFLKGHKVLEISDLDYSSRVGIIIALNEQNRREVIPSLKEKGYKNLF